MKYTVRVKANVVCYGLVKIEADSEDEALANASVDDGWEFEYETDLIDPADETEAEIVSVEEE